MPLVRVYIIVAVMAGGVVAGCGGTGGGENDVAKVKQTMTRELSALADGDGATVCALATPSGRAKLQNEVPGLSCPQIVTVAAQRLPSAIKQGLRNARVNKVTIHGDTATVQDADITSTQGALTGFLKPGSPPTILQKQSDGTWKIAG